MLKKTLRKVILLKEEHKIVFLLKKAFPKKMILECTNIFDYPQEVPPQKDLLSEKLNSRTLALLSQAEMSGTNLKLAIHFLLNAGLLVSLPILLLFTG